MRGREQVFGGEWVVRSAGLTHFRRSGSRVRVLLYIRPPCPRREIAAMGPKDAPCEHPSPAKTFAPAPSAFALPRPRSHFPRMAFRGPRIAIGLPPSDVRPCRAVVRTSPSVFTLPPRSLPRPPRSNRPPAAVVIHNALSTEKLSTSLLAALCKTCSPSRLRTRIIIYRSSVGRSRECPRRCGEEVAPLWPRVPRRRAQGGGGRRQRRTPPRAVPRTFPAYDRTPARLRPNHGAQRRSAQGNPRPCPCVLPATARLRPSPCLLMGESLCAKAEVHTAIPAPARAFSPRQPAYGRAPAR